LAVDVGGQRVHDRQVNVLTVIANESYEAYVSQLQAEYAAEYGAGEQPPKPADARERGVARLRKCRYLSEEFRELWERIKHRTRYAVTIDTERLVQEVVDELDRATIPSPRLAVTKVAVQVTPDDELAALQVSGVRTLKELRNRWPLPNLVWVMEDLLARATPPMRLSRRTLLEVYRRTKHRQAALQNPQGFARVAVSAIRSRLARQLIGGIRYERIGQWYEMQQFEMSEEIRSWLDRLVPAEKCLYDHVLIDSDVEREFAEGLEQRADVRLYVKLPAWFTVPTPIGEYNPDWAVVTVPADEHGEPTGEERLYLVRETKDTTDLDQLRPDERDKIRCGREHFKTLGVDFAVVTSTDELV